MRTSNPVLKTLLLVAVLAGLATACQAGGASEMAGSPRTKPATKPAVARKGGVSADIALPGHTMIAGTSMKGTLVVSNKTGHPMHWSCGYLQVQLVNKQWPLEVHPTPCSMNGGTLRVGTTRLRFTLSAREVVCQGTCKAMPPGTYHTQMFSGPKVVHPGPRTVRVVAGTKPAK